MTVVQFPGRKFSTSAELRNSPLAKPCNQLDVNLEIKGPLAQSVLTAAANAQLQPGPYIARLLGHVFDLGAHHR